MLHFGITRLSCDCGGHSGTLLRVVFTNHPSPEAFRRCSRNGVICHNDWKVLLVEEPLGLPVPTDSSMSVNTGGKK
jgi:hypothetical protein